MINVTVRKRRGDFALEASFELAAPGVVALFGRSGCGKTTLIELIAGLTRADQGRIEVDGHVLVDTDAGVHVPAERRRIGYVFQEARLFPHLSVAGNLRYALSRAKAPPFIGWDQVIGLLDLGKLLARGPRQLSGGERQRVAIGRALLSQPRLLLLDEPLASLDAARREEVLPYLEQLRDALALPMVYVSHQFEEILRLATHVVLLQDGRTVAQGDIGAMSLDARVRRIVGPDAVGAVVDGEVAATPGAAHPDAAGDLRCVRVGRGELSVPAPDLRPGARVRVQLLARDVIVSTEAPRGLSVRNALPGVVVSVTADEAASDLIGIDVGGVIVLARITSAATRDLGLAPGTPVWALVKSVSLRGHAFQAPARVPR